MKNLVLLNAVCVTAIVVCGAQTRAAEPMNADGSKSFAIFNPENEHYYEFVGERELSYPQAKAKAEARVLVIGDKRLKGYLATLTDEHEQKLLDKHFADPPTLHTDVWLGGSDAAVDDEWRWVTGPEAKLDGGKGKLFYKDGRVTTYANWRKGEPNNSGGIESYIQWNHFLRKGDVAGTWNDQPIDKAGSSGYFVEFGE